MRAWDAREKIIEFLEDDPNWELVGVEGSHIIAKQRDYTTAIKDVFDKYEDGVHIALLLGWDIDNVEQYMDQVRKFEAIRDVPSVAVLEEIQIDDDIRESFERREWLEESGVHDEGSGWIFVEVVK